jgi:heat shock protein HslJ
MSTTQTDTATINRRRRPRRRMVIAVAVLVLVGGTAVIGIAAAKDDPPPAGVDPHRTAPAELLGTWQPTFIKGSTEVNKPNPKAPNITFADDGQWRGSDGCNGIGGTYDADPGEISAQSGPQTMIGCHNVPHVEVLAESTHFRVNGTTLALYDADWNQLASYTRTQ